jgi:hypothetical protein
MSRLARDHPFTGKPVLPLLTLFDILFGAVCVVTVFALAVRLFWRRGMRP